MIKEKRAAAKKPKLINRSESAESDFGPNLVNNVIKRSSDTWHENENEKTTEMDL